MIYWFIHILILGLLSYLAYSRLTSSYKPIIFWLALGLKFAAGIALGLIFKFYYEGGDTFDFFENAVELSQLNFPEHFNAIVADGSYTTNNHPRELFLIKILSVFASITNGSYWLTSLYFSVFSFLASWFFVITMVQIFPKTKTCVLIAFLFIPSIVFWSSGILKDTLASSAILFSTSILLKGIYLRKSSIIEIVFGVLSLLVLLHIKHYLFITFILYSGLFISLHMFRYYQKKIKWLLSLSIMVVALISTQFIHPYLTWDRIPQTILEINETISEKSSNQDQSMIKIERPTWGAVIKAMPQALFSGLFRPSIFDSTIPFGWVHKVENFVLIVLSILSVLIWMKEKPDIALTQLFPALISIFLLAAMLALTTPNFGSLVRYKNAFMPFLFLIVSILPYSFLTSSKSE